MPHFVALTSLYRFGMPPASEASFHLQCANGKVSFQLSAQLVAPADCHFLPSTTQRSRHFLHGFRDEQPHLPRQKGPQQRQRDRACAAANRAAKQLNVKKTADTAVTDLAASVAPVPEASSSPSNESVKSGL